MIFYNKLWVLQKKYCELRRYDISMPANEGYDSLIVSLNSHFCRNLRSRWQTISAANFFQHDPAIMNNNMFAT